MMQAEKVEVVRAYYVAERTTLLKRLGFGAGTPENAEDILQEAFVRALKYLDTFDPEVKCIGSWFSSILTNARKDFKRDEWLFGMCEEFEEDEYLPQEMVVDEVEFRRVVSGLIGRVGPKEREILTLYYKHDYSRKDIHCITGVTDRNIKHHLYEFQKLCISKMKGG